jgi:ribosomal 30S subunit maturation factor RimM
VVETCSVRDRDSVIAGFEGIDTVESAEKLRGEELSVLRRDLPRIPGMLPVALFTGLRVVWKQGEGTVAGADKDAANTLLRIDSGGREFPLPLAMVLSEGRIDWERNLLEIDLPEGLTDLEGGF